MSSAVPDISCLDRLHMFKAMKNNFINYYEKNEKQIEIAFFAGGFIWDIVMISDIDDLFSMLQQLIYLFIIASLLHYEILFRLHKWKPALGFSQKLWNYRNLILHFLLGSLLSVYSLFYIKSSSFLSSIIFLIFMIGLLVANELPFLKNAKVSFKMGLYVICLFSFISILFPLALGFLGLIPFGLSVLTTLVIVYFQIQILKKRLPDEKTLFRAVAAPGISVAVVFTLFYFLGWIPPVPLSAKTQGIYHNVEKKDGKYFLSTQKIWWKFWLTGDQDFKARPGDKIFYYVQIYSPARFADQIFVRWLYKDPRIGWQKTDRIAVNIVGGREQGFRATITKSNYQPGDWQIRLETALGHEISRLNFTVTNDLGEQPRNFEVIEK